MTNFEKYKQNFDLQKLVTFVDAIQNCEGCPVSGDCNGLMACGARIEEWADKEYTEKDGCEFCKQANFGNFGVKCNKYCANIYLAGGAYGFPKEEQFKFCPNCGKSLT